MVSKFFISAIVLFAHFTPALFAQSIATITIKKNQNGVETEETRSFRLEEGQDISQVLSEMGILDENGPKSNEYQLEIKIDSSSNLDLKFPSYQLSKSFAKPIKETRPFLGVRLQTKSKQLIVNEVEAASAAEKAGLQKGDIILAINGESIDTYANFVSCIQNKKVGEKIKITVQRNNKKKKLTAVLGQRTMEIYQPLDMNKGKNSGNQLYNFRFGPDSISIFSVPGDTTKDGQPFTWDNQTMKTEDMPYLGVTPDYNQNSTPLPGVAINVEPNTPAEKMGLKNGDIITSFNQIVVSDFNELANAVAASAPGDWVKISLLRNGNPTVLEGELGKRKCSKYDDFRIFHDFKGMDDGGNFFYDYELDLDWNDLEQQMREWMDSIGGSENGMFHSPDNFRFNPTLPSSQSRLRIEEVTSAQTLPNSDLHLSTGEGFDRISLTTTPAMGQLMISLKGNSNTKLQLMFTDHEGNRLITEERKLPMGEYDQTLNLNDFPAGVYYLQLAQGTTYYLKRIIKE